MGLADGVADGTGSEIGWTVMRGLLGLLSEGLAVGGLSLHPAFVGETVGLLLHPALVGARVGARVGFFVGADEGHFVGFPVGSVLQYVAS